MKITDTLFVRAFDPETDAVIPLDDKMALVAKEYVREFTADGSAPPVGHHFANGILLEFSKREPGCIQ